MKQFPGHLGQMCTELSEIRLGSEEHDALCLDSRVNTAGRPRRLSLVSVFLSVLSSTLDFSDVFLQSLLLYDMIRVMELSYAKQFL